MWSSDCTSALQHIHYTVWSISMIIKLTADSDWRSQMQVNADKPRQVWFFSSPRWQRRRVLVGPYELPSVAPGPSSQNPADPNELLLMNVRRERSVRYEQGQERQFPATQTPELYKGNTAWPWKRQWSQLDTSAQIQISPFLHLMLSGLMNWIIIFWGDILNILRSKKTLLSFRNLKRSFSPQIFIERMEMFLGLLFSHSCPKGFNRVPLDPDWSNLVLSQRPAGKQSGIQLRSQGSWLPRPQCHVDEHHVGRKEHLGHLAGRRDEASV